MAFPLLDAATVTHQVEVTAGADFLGLPAAAAVVIVESADGRTLLLATTADARGLARKRLGEIDPTQARMAQADLRPLATGGRALAIRVGSSLEADAVYMRQARARLPHLARVVSERRRAWFVYVDPEAEFPLWTKTNLLGLVRARSASTSVAEPSEHLPRGAMLGPLPDKDAAGRFIECVIDAFDLCRFHNLLVQAPKAAACAYKEMGRCPAPCDGTETMSGYRERTRRAIDVVASGGVVEHVAELEARMHEAAGASEFERAGEMKKLAARLGTLGKPAFAHISRLTEWRVLAILPSASAGAVRGALFDAGTLTSLGDFDAADAERCGAEMLECARGAAGMSRSREITAETIDTIGLFSRWLFAAKKKRGGAAVRMSVEPAKTMELARMIRAVANPKGPAAEVETFEIEGEGAAGPV